MVALLKFAPEFGENCSPYDCVRRSFIESWQFAGLDEIIAPDTKIEKLAGGFLFTEGPVWVPSTAESDAYLLFSDPNNNVIYRWTPDGQLSIYRTKDRLLEHRYWRVRTARFEWFDSR